MSPSAALRLGLVLLCLGLGPMLPAADRVDDSSPAALAEATAAINKRPEQSDLYLYRGLIWLQQGKLEEATDDFETAMQLDPRNADAWAHRGIVRQEQGKLQAAEADFSMAIKLDAQDASNYLLRGVVRFARGQVDPAIQDWSAALRLDPRQTEALMHRALAWGLKDDFQKALKDCTEALRINPRLRPVWQLQGWILATCPNPRFRDGARAIPAARKACELSDWKDSLAIETLAAAYAETGDFSTAVQWQRKALALITGDSAALADARQRLALYQSRKPFRDDPQQ